MMETDIDAILQELDDLNENSGECGDVVNDEELQTQSAPDLSSQYCLVSEEFVTEVLMSLKSDKRQPLKSREAFNHLSGAAADFGFALPTTVGIVNHDPTRLRAPGYSFGTRPHEKNRAVGPGPHYKVDTALTPRGTGYSPSFSITGRPRRTVWDSMTSKGPSPNTYNTPASNRMSASWEKAAPMYSFGGPFRGQKKPAVPAPNTYRIPGTIGSHAPDLKASGPSSTLHGKGAESKGFSHDFAKTPGPAKYDPVDLTHTQRRAPAVTMKRRTKLPSNDPVTPGPAAYDPSNLEKYNKSGPRVTALRAHYSDSLRPPLFTMTDVSI